jgi:ABC-2 type transport system permease protein
MKRHLKILALFWSTSFAAEAEYRVNFALSTISSVGGLVGSVFGLSLFYRNDRVLDGWPWHHALAVMGVFTLLEGFQISFLTPNLGRIVRHVQTGTLDFVLLKPVDSQFWVSLRNFSPAGLPDMALGIGMLIYAGVKIAAAPIDVLLFVPAVLAAFIIHYCLWFFLAATTIWFVKIYNVTEVLRQTLEAGRYPIGVYPAGYRFFFTFIIPVAFLTTVPAQVLLGRAHWPWVVGMACVVVLLLAASRAFWRFALRFYTSASS